MSTPQGKCEAQMNSTEACKLRGFNLLFLTTQVIGLAGIVLMLIWINEYCGGFGWRSTPSLEFNWHPLLFAIGLIYLYANGILIYRALRAFSKKALKLIHGAIHLVVIVLTVVAIIAVLDSHNFSNPPRKNFYSLHCWMGIVTVAIYISQWIVGLTGFLYPGYPMHWRGAVLPVHVFLGLLAFVLSIATALTGITERLHSIPNYSSFVGGTYIINLMSLIFILFGGMVIYLATETKYKRCEKTGLLSGSSD